MDEEKQFIVLPVTSINGEAVTDEEWIIRLNEIAYIKPTDTDNSSIIKVGSDEIGVSKSLVDLAISLNISTNSTIET